MYRCVKCGWTKRYVGDPPKWLIFRCSSGVIEWLCSECLSASKLDNGQTRLFGGRK